jgi:cbb3-type cytochrome oxidase subunit 3
MISTVNFWRELITVTAFLLFLGITVWAYSKKRKKEFNQINELVIQDDDTSEFVEGSK